MSEHDDEIELVVEELLSGIADDAIRIGRLRPTVDQLAAALRIARSGDEDRILKARQSLRSSTQALVALADTKTRLRLERSIWQIFELAIALVGRAM